MTLARACSRTVRSEVQCAFDYLMVLLGFKKAELETSFTPTDTLDTFVWFRFSLRRKLYVRRQIKSELISWSFLSSVFRQRVLSKLFPSEEESDSEDDDVTRKQLQLSARTESVELHDVTCKSQKRKLSEHEGSFVLLPTSFIFCSLRMLEF